MTSEPQWVGIDVSKKQLDVSLYPSGKGFSLTNNDMAIVRCSLN